MNIFRTKLFHTMDKKIFSLVYFCRDVYSTRVTYLVIWVKIWRRMVHFA